jgi:hypothetical protein
MNNGGPAFPQPDIYHGDGQIEFGTPGMTLRDWFASTALEEDIIAHIVYYADSTEFSRTREEARYYYADAMLKAREVSDD